MLFSAVILDKINDALAHKHPADARAIFTKKVQILELLGSTQDLDARIAKAEKDAAGIFNVFAKKPVPVTIDTAAVQNAVASVRALLSRGNTIRAKHSFTTSRDIIRLIPDSLAAIEKAFAEQGADVRNMESTEAPPESTASPTSDVPAPAASTPTPVSIQEPERTAPAAAPAETTEALAPQSKPDTISTEPAVSKTASAAYASDAPANPADQIAEKHIETVYTLLDKNRVREAIAFYHQTKGFIAKHACAEAVAALEETIQTYSGQIK